jgi:Fe-S-cluster containining protein
MKSIVPAFKKELKRKQRKLTTFLTKLEKYKVTGLTKIRNEADTAAWAATDCLTCANCCRTMTPTFTEKDLLRIAPHFNLSVDAFKTKWLHYEKSDQDWVNKKQPCQFLNLNDNKCSIYAIRPEDCAKFPHHQKKNMDDYMHVFKQNIKYCPATFAWVEHMKSAVEEKFELYK